MGDTDAIQGKVDDVIYNLLGMEDPNYVTRVMATGGRIFSDDTCKEDVRLWKENGEDAINKLKYNLPFDCNFSYCHMFDDHNNLRNSLS